MTEEIAFDGFEEWTTDPNLEVGDGIDIDYGDGKFITIRRAGGRNLAYNKALMKLAPKRRKNLSPEQDRNLMIQVYVDSVIIGWRGFTSDGKPIPFNKANVTRFLLAFPDVFEEIATKATSLDNFLLEEAEETAKN
ncbi:MAG: hypothetical protein OEM91_05050 [Hyphomicrobiales bacterium]|nr:hypothetical protein [Hyphomicrobiales bacterium]